MSTPFTSDDEVCVNNIRTLAGDVVNKSNSGHPGMPMGMAPIAHVLWDRHMKFAPTHPKWAARDRFVLSNGHGCALQYIMLHLTGYDSVPMKELQSFRQLGSKTPGHPECFVTDGIEVTTGPLGQGICNAVGLAMAEAQAAAQFNKPGFNIIDNYTYTFLGDGCLQEGVASEACSLAGHWGLGKLIVFYDDNKITIDGDTKLSFTENVPMRMRAYGWHTITVMNGDTDLVAILDAIEQAKAVTDRPTLISVKTVIGYGSTKQGSHSVHGSPLGAKDAAQLKAKFGFDPKQNFQIRPETAAKYGVHKAKGQALVDDWNKLVASYAKQYPAEAADLARRIAGKLPENWDAKLPTYKFGGKAEATRNLSNQSLNACAATLTELTGGSADLTPSNKTSIKTWSSFQKDNHDGRYIRFGIREHGMVAIANGIASYGLFIPFTATFLNFIQYALPAVRIAALSGHKQILIMTHDSIGLGEDGPTHQPVEVVSQCRSTPCMNTWRPADGNEVAAAYYSAVTFNGPSVLCLSRQGMPVLEASTREKALKGAYVAADCAGKPDLILIGTGSEVSLCVAAAAKLSGKKVRVVSMPCQEVFDKQSVAYRRSLLVPGVPTIAVEMLATYGWEKYSHYCIGMQTYGASAPIKDLLEYFGFTPDKVAATATKMMAEMSSDNSAMGTTSWPALPTHYTSAPLLRAHL